MFHVEHFSKREVGVGLAPSPAAVEVISAFDSELGIKNKFKGGGQECPRHTVAAAAAFIRLAPRLTRLLDLFAREQPRSPGDHG
jgi:hypothetical protein